jgi:hypothetical protein
MQQLSLNTELLKDIFKYAKPLGHNEKPGNLNLGFGFLYYGPFKTLGGTGKWDDPQKVQDHFKLFEVEDLITHCKSRSDEFFPYYESYQLP